MSKRDLEHHAAWLLARSKEIICKAKVRSVEGVDIWTPAGSKGFYNESIYPRDFYYTVIACPECFTDKQLKQAIELLLKAQNDDGRMPNSVSKDGEPWYWLYDNSQFMVNLIHFYVLKTGDDDFFRENAGRLEKSMKCLPRNKKTNLVTTNNPDLMYGFNDNVEIIGDDLFTSLLAYEASRNMAELFGRLGEKTFAKYWLSEAFKIKEGLSVLYNDNGYFLTASKLNTKPSVWGSAFAVYIEAVTKSQSLAIGNWLKHNYDAVVQRGQVRHLPEPEYWQSAPLSPRGTYQNGGYWATPFAWVNQAIRNVDVNLANKMLFDILNDFKEYGVNEVVNYDISYVNRKGHAGEYCASLAPLIVLRDLGVEFNNMYKNLALMENRAVIRASSVLGGGKNPQYQIKHLNDGLYGDVFSWIPSESDAAPWIEIELAQISQIDMLVFGRDNWSDGKVGEQEYPNRNGFSDRNISEFTIWVSMDNSNWGQPVYEKRGFEGLHAGQNCVIDFPAPLKGRYLKFAFQPNAGCIDQIEVFGSHATGVDAISN